MMREIEIDSVSQFLHYVDKTLEQTGADFRQRYVSGKTHFRGHSDKHYQVVPSLFRPVQMGNELNERFYEHEQILIQEALQLLPSEFLGLTQFQQLCKMQHLGLPTRLLDVTSNPLVALFFASADNRGSDGEVIYIPPLPVFDEAHASVRDLINFSFRGDWNALNLNEFGEQLVGGDSMRADDDSAQYALQVLTIPFTIVAPTFSNPRVRAQAGAFLLPGMEVESTSQHIGRQYVRFRTNLTELTRLHAQGYPGDGVKEGRFRVVIPARNKRKLREQLDRVGINESSLFPEPEHQMHYIAVAYRKGYRGLDFGWEKRFEN